MSEDTLGTTYTTERHSNAIVISKSSRIWNRLMTKPGIYDPNEEFIFPTRNSPFYYPDIPTAEAWFQTN